MSNMNFVEIEIAFNQYLKSIGYELTTIGNICDLLNVAQITFYTTISYKEYSECMLQHNSEYYSSVTDITTQCYEIYGDYIHLPPTLYNDVLYAYFYMLQWECSYPTFELVSAIMDYCDSNSQYYTYTTQFVDILSVCRGENWQQAITTTQNEFLVWYALRFYPFNNQIFKLSELTDYISNMDIVYCRELPFAATDYQNTLESLRVFRNRDHYIKIV